MPTISGTTKTSLGVAIPGVTVHAFRSSDNVLVATAVSDGSGNFLVTVPSTVNHFLRAYIAGAPDKAGTTRNDIVPDISSLQQMTVILAGL